MTKSIKVQAIDQLLVCIDRLLTCIDLYDKSAKLAKDQLQRENERLRRIPTPKMVAAAWAVIERGEGGVKKLGPGLGVCEIWQAMFDAARATLNQKDTSDENDLDEPCEWTPPTNGAW